MSATKSEDLKEAAESGFFTVQSELIFLCKLADVELSSTSGGVYIIMWR